MKTTLISSVSHLKLGLKFCLGASPQKPPRGDVTEFWGPVSLGDNLADICLVPTIAYSG